MTDSIYAALETKLPILAAKRAELGAAQAKKDAAFADVMTISSELHRLQRDFEDEVDRVTRALAYPGADILSAEATP